MSKIEWTQKTWNPTIGCDEVSAGCRECYAAKMAFRLSHIPMMKEEYAGLTKKLPNGRIVWTGLVKRLDHRLVEPLLTNKPTVWFLDSMSDLFHKDVPFDFIDLVFAAMAIAKQHTFQILTKRADRMLEYFEYKDKAWLHAGMQNDERVRFQTYHHFGKGIAIEDWQWPLQNVWLGVSVEDQKAAKERVPYLANTPAAVRFLSCEPLLSSVNLYPWLNLTIEARTGKPGSAIDWVICGGESGNGARPMHPDWARSLRDQCKDANVPFFFKQWGEYAPHMANEATKIIGVVSNGIGYDMCRVGKKKAGRLLDGVLHDEYPNVTSDTTVI